MATKQYLDNEFVRQSKSKFGVSGWLRFCLYFSNAGFIVTVKKSQVSCSRYITIAKRDKKYTVRFSQHSNRGKYQGAGRKADLEIGGDTATLTTAKAIEIAENFFIK